MFGWQQGVEIKVCRFRVPLVLRQSDVQIIHRSKCVLSVTFQSHYVFHRIRATFQQIIA